MRKNPSHGTPVDYKLCSNTFISEESSMEEHITIDRCNYKTTDARRVQVCGIIVDRFRSRIIITPISKPKHVKGLHIKQKRTKTFNILQQSPSQCQVHPSPCTPASPSQASLQLEPIACGSNSKKILQIPQPLSTLEGTHLSERLGKHMVTTPLSCIVVVKAHVEILTSKDPSLDLDDKLPTGPILQE